LFAGSRPGAFRLFQASHAKKPALATFAGASTSFARRFSGIFFVFTCMNSVPSS
jgi:hypothetical protein